jgi:hypothetical protein
MVKTSASLLPRMAIPVLVLLLLVSPAVHSTNPQDFATIHDQRGSSMQGNNLQGTQVKPSGTVKAQATSNLEGSSLMALSTSNVQYYGGPVANTLTLWPIFWLPAGYAYENGGSDSNYKRLIMQFLSDLQGSDYYNILTQYFDNVNGLPLNTVTVKPMIPDSATYPCDLLIRGGCSSANPLYNTDFEAEVTKEASAQAEGPDNLYLVFTGSGVYSCTDLAKTECSFGSGYCANQGQFPSSTGSQLVYINMPDIQTSISSPSSSCIPPSPLVTRVSPNHDYIADYEISNLSHEIFESVSDPLRNAWYDTTGPHTGEIGDKCVSQDVQTEFGTNGNFADGNLVLNGHPYIVQQEWSNIAGACTLSLPFAKPEPITLTPSLDTVVSTVPTSFSVTVKNPSSNSYSITSVTIVSPPGWSFSLDQSYNPTCGNSLNTLASNSQFEVQCSTGGDGIAPGSSDTLNLGAIIGALSPVNAPPPKGTFLGVETNSASAGPFPTSSFSMTSIARTTVALMPDSATNINEGSSPLIIVATLSSGQPGVQIHFTDTNNGANGEILSPAVTSTDAGGTGSTSFTPSSQVGIYDQVVATIGVGSGISGASGIIKVVAASSTSSASVPPPTTGGPVSITLTNSQSMGTPVPFQQRITFNPSLYSSIEASNLGNIRFCSDSACATQLSAWLESCSPSCGISATSATVWVKLDNSIPPNGRTLTIYMNFLSASTDFDGVYWGEAPALSTTYGQYDNGASVFPTLYQNFAGGSVPSGWTNNGGTIDNGFVTTAGSAAYLLTTAKYGVDPNQILDVYGYSSTIVSGEHGGLGYQDSSDENGCTGCQGVVVGTAYLSVSTTNYAYETQVAAFQNGFIDTGIRASTTYHVWTIYWPSSSSATFWADYGGKSTINSNVPGLTQTLGAASLGNVIAMQWIRIRAYPPNGVLPAFSIGPPVTLTSSSSSSSSTTSSISSSSSSSSSSVPEFPTILVPVIALASLATVAILGRRTSTERDSA